MSTRGAVMRSHASWNIVSMSCTDAVPRTPSPLPSMPAATFTFFPASFLPSAIALNDPTPLRDITTELRSALTTSASGTSDSPPAERAAKSTSSALKSVGLSRTFAPFDSVHSMIPVSGSVRSATILPGAGGAGTSAASGGRIHVRGERGPSGGVEHLEHRGGRRHVDVGLVGRGDEHDAVLVAERRLVESASTSARVIVGASDFVSGACCSIPMIGVPQSALLTYSVDEPRGVRLVPFRELLLHRPEDVGALAVELGLREAEPRNALRLGQQRLRGLLEAALLHAGNELVGVLGPYAARRARPARTRMVRRRAARSRRSAR